MGKERKEVEAWVEVVVRQRESVAMPRCVGEELQPSPARSFRSCCDRGVSAAIKPVGRRDVPLSISFTPEQTPPRPGNVLRRAERMARLCPPQQPQSSASLEQLNSDRSREEKRELRGVKLQGVDQREPCERVEAN